MIDGIQVDDREEIERGETLPLGVIFDDDVELDSPKFEHPALNDLKKRNFTRINSPRE